jgi:hypothetical protein
MEETQTTAKIKRTKDKQWSRILIKKDEEHEPNPKTQK